MYYSMVCDANIIAQVSYWYFIKRVQSYYTSSPFIAQVAIHV